MGKRSAGGGLSIVTRGRGWRAPGRRAASVPVPGPLPGAPGLAEVCLDCSGVLEPHGRCQASQLSGAEGWYGGAHPDLAAGMDDETGAGQEMQVGRVGERPTAPGGHDQSQQVGNRPGSQGSRPEAAHIGVLYREASQTGIIGQVRGDGGPS